MTLKLATLITAIMLLAPAVGRDLQRAIFRPTGEDPISVLLPAGRLSAVAASFDGSRWVGVVQSKSDDAIKHTFVIANREGQQVRTISGSDATVPSVALSPAGSRLAFVRYGQDPGLFVRRVMDQVPAPDRLLDAKAVRVAWSHHGREIAWLRQTDDALELVVYSLVEETRRQLKVGASASKVDLAWDFSDNTIAVLVDDLIFSIDAASLRLPQPVKTTSSARRLFLLSETSMIVQTKKGLMHVDGRPYPSTRDGGEFAEADQYLEFKGRLVPVLLEDD